MTPEILRVDYPVLQGERNIPTNGGFLSEAPFAASNQSLVEAEHPQPNMGDYGYPNPGNIHQDVINESTQNSWRYLEASAFDDPLDLAFFF